MKKLLPLSLMLLVLCVSGCIFSDNDKKTDSGQSALVGTWDSADYSYTFKSDGTFTFYYATYEATSSGTYKVTGNIVELSSMSGGIKYTDKYTFSVNGNRLTLTNVYNNEDTLTYTKK